VSWDKLKLQQQKKLQDFNNVKFAKGVTKRQALHLYEMEIAKYPVGTKQFPILKMKELK